MFGVWESQKITGYSLIAWTMDDAERKCTGCIKRTESKECSLCGKFKSQKCFSSEDWKTELPERKCKQCIKEHSLKKQCSVCGISKPRSEYSSRVAWNRDESERKCAQCAICDGGKSKNGLWTCNKCGLSTEKDNFSEWLVGRTNKVKQSGTQCNHCIEQNRLAVKAMNEASLKVLRDSIGQK